MHPDRIIAAAICTTIVFCSDPFTLQRPLGGQHAEKSVGSKDDTVLCLRSQPGFSLYTLQQNGSSNQQPCVWSDNHKQQYCVFADPQFDHGKGITVITTPERARHIFKSKPKSNASVSNRPGYTEEPLFKTKASGSKGRGIFANSHIPVGGLITQESPIILLDWNWIEDILSTDVRTTLQALAIEKLPRITRQIFHELYEGPETDIGRQKVLTNGYGVSGGPTEDWPGLENESDHGMITVHANISKINHSCRPNAAVQWDWGLLAHKLYAVRNIAADEEITISYINPIQALQERQQYTRQKLGFECACSQCKAATQFAELSDDRVNEILLLEQYLESRQIAPAEPTAMAELLVTLYKQEGLDSHICKAYAIAAREWNGVGYEYQARSWAYQSVQAGLIAGSEMEDYLKDMNELLNGARKHWSWRYRVHP